MLLIMIVMAQTGFATGINAKDKIQLKYLDELKQDEMFQMMEKEANKEQIENYIERYIEVKTKLEMNKNRETRRIHDGYSDGGYQSVRMIPIRQKNSYYCGVAAALQTLYSLRCDDKLDGETFNEKQDYLADDINPNPDYGSTVWKVCVAINKYLDSGMDDYIYSKIGYNFGKGEFADVIFASLKAEYPPILHAYTASLDYYNGRGYRHYISINSIDGTDREIRLVDPHYRDEYFGRHWESTTNVYDAVHNTHEGNRYLIYNIGD